MEKWIMFTFLYAIFNGMFQCAKKKSLEKNTIYEVLAYFSTIAFFVVAVTSKNVFEIEASYIFTILLKSIIIIAADNFSMLICCLFFMYALAGRALLFL